MACRAPRGRYLWSVAPLSASGTRREEMQTVRTMDEYEAVGSTIILGAGLL